jgi:hypothetical protein
MQFQCPPSAIMWLPSSSNITDFFRHKLHLRRRAGYWHPGPSWATPRRGSQVKWTAPAPAEQPGDLAVGLDDDRASGKTPMFSR